jgi:hypothetical protein
MWTKQRIFNKVAKHLLKQGRRSKFNAAKGYAVCAYRGDGGARCALGCVIWNKHYNSYLEGQSINSASVQSALEKSLGVSFEKDEDLWSFFNRLQSIHDSVMPAQWRDSLLFLAAKHGLTFSVGTPRKKGT